MNGGGSRRVGVDELLAAALASGKTLADAAQACGCSESTARRRSREPEFLRRVSELRAEMIGRATGRLADTCAEAADALKSLLRSRNPWVKLQAARGILEAGAKMHEIAEVQREVAELKAEVAELKDIRQRRA